MVTLQAKTNLFKIAHIKICLNFGTIHIPQWCCFSCYTNSILQHDEIVCHKCSSLRSWFGTRGLRYTSMVVFRLGAATLSFRPVELSGRH